MKALRVHGFEGLQAWRLEDAPAPGPAAGQVQVRIAASAISFVDQLFARGGYQVKPPLPFTPGTEFAGVVTAVGAGVGPRLAPGTPVTGTVFGGAWAEVTCALAHDLTRLAPGSDLHSASGLSITAATAVYALEQRGRLQAGETVLVLGAAGGIGAACVQVAKALGARVLAGASSAAKRAAALEDGADGTIDTSRPDWREAVKELAPEGIDIVVDPVGGPLTETAFKTLRWGGRHLMLGFAEGAIPSLRGNLPLLKGASWVGVDIRQLREREPRAALENLERTAALFGAGKLRPRVAQVRAASEWAAAMETAARRDIVGRVVLDWSDRSRGWPA